VFAGYAVYITNGVCGIKAPKESEFKEIIESGGGRVIESVIELNKHLSSSSSSSSSSKSNREQLIIISNESGVDDSNVSTDIARALEMGVKVHTAELLIGAVMRQELRFTHIERGGGEVHDHILDFKFPKIKKSRK
jgi:hypothetical protein